MIAPISGDPFTILGVSSDADEAEIRARYLELVKQFPPEREPDKFREIRSAFEAAKDPLTIAWRLTAIPDEDAPPSWTSVLAAQKQHRPRLTPAFLLSLGNRGPGSSAPPSADPQPDIVSPESPQE